MKLRLHHLTDSEQTSFKLLLAKQGTTWILDTETDGLDVWGEGSPNRAHYIGLMPLGTPHVFILSGEQFKQWGLAPLLAKARLAGHNLRFDLHALDIDLVERPWVDTLCAAYFANTTGRRSMDHIAKVHGWSKVPTPDALKKGRIGEVPYMELANYLADDCWTTARMIKQLRISQAETDFRVESAVYAMERRGIRLLEGGLADVSSTLDARIDQARRGLEQAGFAGNPQSSVQIAAWLSGMGRRLPYTPKGSLSTAKIVLSKMAEQGDQLVEKLLVWRKLTKLKNSFVEPLPRLARNGILYPRTNTTRTATGRFSCDTPNLQQIPKRGPLGKAIRGCLTSRNSEGVTACDFSQVELRVAAAFSQEEVLLNAFAAGRCPHSEVAARIHGKVPEQVTPSERFGAKAVNFGILNGMGARRLSDELKTTVAEASRFLSDYRRNLPALHTWMEGVWRNAEKHGLARTVEGRTRVFHGTETTRPAISVIVQGSAAELLRAALVRVDAAGLEPFLSIHDELLIAGTCPKRAKELQEAMEQAADNAYPDAFHSVRFSAEATTGETWGDV